MPPISNVLDMLQGVSPQLHAEVMEDAWVPLEAAMEVEGETTSERRKSAGRLS
jgi:hypothetical protein